MILPDVNLLVYAYNAAAPRHARSKEWWEACLTGPDSVGLSWLVILGYVRIVTSRRALAAPMPPPTALSHVRAWLDRPQVAIITPGMRHLDLFENLIQATGAGGAMTTDVHLAALAIEHHAELHSNDTDFARFPGLRWRNPIS